MNGDELFPILVKITDRLAVLEHYVAEHKARRSKIQAENDKARADNEFLNAKLNEWELRVTAVEEKVEKL